MFPRAGTLCLPTVTCAHLRGDSRQELRTLCWLLCPQGFFLFFFNTWRWEEVSAGALALPRFYQHWHTHNWSEDQGDAWEPQQNVLLFPVETGGVFYDNSRCPRPAIPAFNYWLGLDSPTHFLQFHFLRESSCPGFPPSLKFNPNLNFSLPLPRPRHSQDDKRCSFSNHCLLGCKFLMLDSRRNNNGKEAETDSPPKERSAQETRGSQSRPTWRHGAPHLSVRGRRRSRVQRRRKRARSTNPPTRAARIAPRRERLQRHFPAKWVRASGRWWRDEWRQLQGQPATCSVQFEEQEGGNRSRHGLEQSLGRGSALDSASAEEEPQETEPGPEPWRKLGWPPWRLAPSLKVATAQARTTIRHALQHHVA